MIVVRVELHSARTGKTTEIGRMVVTNDGSSTTPSRGHYDVKLLRKGNWSKITSSVRVENFPRASYTVWKLILRGLMATYPEEVKRAVAEHCRSESAT